MSYFNEIYNDPELSARAKQVLVYLHDRANKDGESWYAINTMAKDSGRPGDVLPIVIEYSKVALIASYP